MKCRGRPVAIPFLKVYRIRAHRWIATTHRLRSCSRSCCPYRVPIERPCFGHSLPRNIQHPCHRFANVRCLRSPGRFHPAVASLCDQVIANHFPSHKHTGLIQGPPFIKTIGGCDAMQLETGFRFCPPITSH